jgi:hypothetical protein
MTRFVPALLCVLFLAVMHGQAALTGQWKGSTDMRRELVLDLKASDDQLTGTFALDQQSAPIREGKITGATFSFAVTVGGRTASFTGELMSDSMKLTPQGGAPVVLKRVK